MANKRVNELTEKSVVDGSDYLIVDSATVGTKKLQMSTLLAALNGLAIVVVSELPTTDIDTHTLYLVPKSNPTSPDIYNEYMYINNAWELIGSTEVNLTNYYTKTEVDTALASKQDELTFDTAPTASSTNPVESGGVKTALDAKQDTLTFDSTPTASSTNPVTSEGVKRALDAKQETLTAGDNITIDANNRISASSVGTKYTKTVDLTKTASRTIAFDPTGYSYTATDTVDVYINGLHAIENTDYTLSVSGTSLSVVLTLTGTTGVTEKIEIVVIK